MPLWLQNLGFYLFLIFGFVISLMVNSVHQIKKKDFVTFFFRVNFERFFQSANLLSFYHFPSFIAFNFHGLKNRKSDGFLFYEFAHVAQTRIQLEKFEK